MGLEKEARRYITVGEVANLLTVHPSTIYRWIADASIPHIKLRGRVVFDQGEVESWLRCMYVKVAN
ncbi:MAG: helix-turn-helix domain-containing protein [Saprospiraceae bacterium]|nr:helix-turn-helix domain-containing protein [Saprospiraceae bacterium]